MNNKFANKWLKFAIITIVSFAITWFIMYLLDKGSAPSIQANDIGTQRLPQPPQDVPVIFSVENALSEDGWLVACADSTIDLKYAVVPGLNPVISDEEWKRISRPLHCSDTLRPKRNCVIFLRAETERNDKKCDYYVFNFCSFVENLIHSNYSDTRLQQLLRSYTERCPLVINYDYVIEETCRIDKDKGLYDNFLNSLYSNDGHYTYHIDSIKTYSTTTPTEEALLAKYPPIAFINASSAQTND